MDKLKEFSDYIETLYEVTRIIHKYDKEPRFYGTDVALYVEEMHTLDKIFNNEGINITSLAEMTRKTKSAVTQLTKKLEKKGVIQRLRNKDYHKEINLFTTEVGRNACIYHNSLDESVYKQVLDRFNRFNIEDFHKCTEILEITAKIMMEYNHK